MVYFILKINAKKKFTNILFYLKQHCIYPSLDQIHKNFSIFQMKYSDKELKEFKVEPWPIYLQNLVRKNFVGYNSVYNPLNGQKVTHKYVQKCIYTKE